ncbi:hypothetical protein ACROYT_G020925 [Oculina patagonica]
MNLATTLASFLKIKEGTLLIYCLYFVGFLDLFAVSCFLPLLTHRARELGASPSLVGIIGSIYGGLQFFSSPIMGKLSDIFGRKQLLLVSLLGAALSYYLMALPTTLLFLALSRIPIGIFKHSQSVAKTYLSDVSPSVDHPKVFGNFNAFSSLGFVIGPLIGGHLAMHSNGFRKVTILTGSIFVINFLFAWFFLIPVEQVKGQSSTRQEQVLSEDNTKRTISNKIADQQNGGLEKDTKNLTPSKSVETSSGVTSIYKISSMSSTLDLLVIRFVMGFSMLVFRSNLTSMLEFHFNTTPKTNGYIMSYNGLVGGFSGILVGQISKFYNHNDAKMLLHFSLILTASILGITFSPSITFVAVFIAPLAVSSAVSRVCITNLTLRRGREDEKGVILGIGNSLLSFARMISPALGGVAQEVSAYAPGSIGALIAGTGVLTMVLFPPDRPAVMRDEKKDK